MSHASLPRPRTRWKAEGDGLKYRSSDTDSVFTAPGKNKRQTLHLHCFYRVGRPICRKVLKKMFWEVPPADWLIL